MEKSYFPINMKKENDNTKDDDDIDENELKDFLIDNELINKMMDDFEIEEKIEDII